MASGIGSLVSVRLGDVWRGRILLLLPFLTLGLALGLGGAAEALAALPAAGRIAGCAALVVLLGLPMGLPLPAGIARAATHGGRGIPLMFGVNGAFSVLGSVLAMIVQLNAGVRATMIAGAAAYLVAAALLGRIGRK